MSPNGISSGFDETFIFSSDSSDSEFLLQEDVKSRGNQINKQWEAIERTLYQEPGQQVTDPELLKECKLWRETFPHFRVKGTKIDVNKPEKDIGEADKNVQTLQNHFNLKVLEEKRESIKKKVVGVLVERLIAKFGSEKRESAKSEGGYSSGVQITEIDDETADKISNWPSGGLKEVQNSMQPPAVTRKESYFERGKPPGKGTYSPEDQELTVEQVEKRLCEIFDSWTGDDKTAIKLPETAESANTRKAANSTRKNLILTSDKSNRERLKPHKFPPSDSLSSLAKPFEMTKKIDKKYEGLIEKIMERQQNGLDGRRHFRTNSSGLEKSYQDSLAKLRMGSRFDERPRNRNVLRLNKFSNNWLERSEADAYHRSAGDDIFQERGYKSNGASKSSYGENVSQREMDERFLEELKREMAANYKRPSKKSGVVEEISLRRPKPFRSTPEMAVSSSGFADYRKGSKKEVKGGVVKRGLEAGKKESNVRNGVKSNNCNGSKGNRMKGSQNSLLPPIETDESDCTPKENLTELITTFKARWPVEGWKRIGLFNDDYLLKINIYWLKFPPPSPISHYILGALYIVIMIVGIVGNLLIIVMFVRRRSFRTHSNIFIMNLAVSDALLLLKMPLFIFNSFYLGPALGSLGCSIYGFVGGLTGTVSIMTLAAIAFDRYQVIVHPLAHKTRIMIYVQILLIWLYGLFFSAIPLLDIGLNKYVPEGYLTACSFDYLTKDIPSRVTILVFFVAAWVVPITIITVSYGAMYKTIFQGLKGHFDKQTRHCKEMEKCRTELRVAVTVISVISLWTLSWTPYAVVALMGVTGNEKYLTPTSSMIPALFCKTASCIDPYVYAITNPRFRNELRKGMERSSRIQRSVRTVDRRDIFTTAEDPTERRRAPKRESVDEIIVLASPAR